MTADASRSCLGLATSVGSATRQIVETRVLLTAAVPPALPGSSMFAWFAGASLGCDHAFVPISPPPAARTGAMAQMKPASSRAIAPVTTLAGLPLRASRR